MFKYHVIHEKLGGKVAIILCAKCHKLIHKWNNFLKYYNNKIQKIQDDYEIIYLLMNPIVD